MIRINVNLILSSENTTLYNDIKEFLGENNHVSPFYIDYIPGHGQSKNELNKTKSDLYSIKHSLKDDDIVLYARSYSAFNKDGWNLIKNTLKPNKAYISTESIINIIKARKSKKVFLITPYNQYRHDYEVKWLRGFKINVIGSIALGRTGGPMIASTPKQMIEDAYKVATDSDADFIYIACTILSTLPIIDKLKSDIPTITAASSMLIEAGLMKPF